MNSPRILPLLAAVLLAGTAMDAAASRAWTEVSGRSFQADLLRFDLASKTIVLKDESGIEHTMATESLTLRSRFQLLFSLRFLQAFPDEQWSSHRLRIILTLAGISGLFFLAGFWLSAIFIAHNPSPFKAILGWGGSLMVSAGLLTVYLTAARKFPEHATGIMSLGVAVATLFASVFVSVIYNSKVGSAMALFVLHLAAGTLLFVGALHGLDTWGVPPNVEALITEGLMRPIGLL